MEMSHFGRSFLSASLVIALLFLFVAKQNQTNIPIWKPVRMPEFTLVIDPGHGGEDGGAVSISGAVESHINLAVALRLRAILDFWGIRSLMLRETDCSLHDSTAKTLRQKKVSDLHNRVDKIESVENAVLISIHQNSFTSPKYHGAQIFFGSNPNSIPLANTVQTTIQETLDPENTRVPALIPSTVYLMNHVTCPAILVECGFLSNAEEDRLLQTPEHQTKLAAILASSFLTYQQREGESFHEE